MSAKKYFQKQKQGQANKVSQLAGNAVTASIDVESTFHIQEKKKFKQKFTPNVDYSHPENFAKYGSATKYYEDAVKRIYNLYPYDGSHAEKLSFENSLTPLEKHILDNKYPKTTGYAAFSPLGWGTKSTAAGDPTTKEYIFFYGGPHVNNVYHTSSLKVNNLKVDYETGNTVEFWLKKEAWPHTTNQTRYEVLLDMRSNAPYNETNHRQLEIYLDNNTATTKGEICILDRIDGDGGPTNIINACLDTGIADIADSKWHHYAITIEKNSSNNFITSSLYVDGAIADVDVTESHGTLSSWAGYNERDGETSFAALGAFAAPTIESGTALKGWYKLSGSMDEFRFWKKNRTAREIGTSYFTNVHGGTNTDTRKYSADKPVDLGVYFKFNEGITGDEVTDSVVLDYSGRISNGAWTGYSSASRNTGSAITQQTDSTEPPDVIIRTTHPSVVSLETELEASGTNWDATNGGSLYSMIPQWMSDEDAASSGELKNLTQILGSYLDTLYLQIQALATLKEPKYLQTGSHEASEGLPSKLLNSYGFDTPEFMINQNVLSSFLSQDEKRIFEDKIHNLKNLIYRNVYNNLPAIYKSKGTEKSFRNLFRCFGVDDNLVKIKLYGDNTEVVLDDEFFSTVATKKSLDLSGILHGDNRSANLFNYKTTAQEAGFIPHKSSPDVPATFETEILFPKFASNTKNYGALEELTKASLFGCHSAKTETDTSFADTDMDFQVFANRDSKERISFMLTSSNGWFPVLTSSYYPVSTSDLKNVYDNTKWNFAVSVKPTTYPFSRGVITSSAYTLEFYGVNYSLGDKVREFSLTDEMTHAKGAGFITGSNKRFYVGAHRTNFTGSILEKTNVKVLSARYWETYLENHEIQYHARDTDNFGTFHPSRNAYLFEFKGKPTNHINEIDTLKFHWQFDKLDTATGAGRVLIDDMTSGSNPYHNNQNYPAYGQNFEANSKLHSMEFINASRLQLPEDFYSSDLIQIRSADDTLFGPSARPNKFFYSVESSMYDIISENMMQFFASLVEYNTLIGIPVEAYRTRYKGLEKLRAIFFERIKNTPDLEKFVQIYKFIDSSLDSVIRNLVPASAATSDEVRTIVESHVLERNKHPRKFPIFAHVNTNINLDTSDTDGTDTEDETSTKNVYKEQDEPEVNIKEDGPTPSPADQPDIEEERLCEDPLADNYQETLPCRRGGCTDVTAINYDAKATYDDGSCRYQVRCENPKADNFGAQEPCRIPGCTDANAMNYESDATYDDGTCRFEKDKYSPEDDYVDEDFENEVDRTEERQDERTDETATRVPEQGDDMSPEQAADYDPEGLAVETPEQEDRKEESPSSGPCKLLYYRKNVKKLAWQGAPPDQKGEKLMEYIEHLNVLIDCVNNSEISQEKKETQRSALESEVISLQDFI